MFTENEIATLIEMPEILEATQKIKADFIEKEVSMLDISDHDFLSLIMLTPPMGIALANGSISLFEELGLNKMARQMSKGGYFLKVDPVVHAMKFALRSFEAWERRFLDMMILCMDTTIDMQAVHQIKGSSVDDPAQAFARDIMRVPYMFVRFLSCFILNEEADMVGVRSISRVEFDKIVDIGHKLGIGDLHVFKSFCNTFQIK